MTDDDLPIMCAPIVALALWGWATAGARHCAESEHGLATAIAGVLVALVGAWVEAARQSLRERVARIEGRVEALEKSR